MAEEKTKAIVPRSENPPAKTDIPPVSQPPKKITDGFGAEIAQLIHLSGTIELTGKQEKTLFAPLNEKDVEIRPDGLIYLPWMEYVTRLKECFGMRWTLLPEGLPKNSPGGNSIMWGFWLVIDGKPYGFAIGEQEYYPENKTMSWSDACEGAKSNALMRVCKGIGISLELWRPSFIKGWKKKFAVQVQGKDRYGNPKLIWAKKEPEKTAEEVREQEAVMPKKEEIKEALPTPLPESKTKGKESSKPTPAPNAAAKSKEAEKSKPAAEPPKDEKERLIENIKVILAKKTFDLKHFKTFLYDFAKTHKVKFVDLNQFHNLSFHEGDLNDLRRLVVNFEYLSDEYLKWAKLYQPAPKEPFSEKDEEEGDAGNVGPEEEEEPPF